MEIYLIRHGECYTSTIEYNESKKTMDPPLTNQGIQQAKELSLQVADIDFDRIYCSDLKRSIQTAEIMKASKTVEIVTTTAFREIDMGYLYKKTWDDYPEIYRIWETHDEDIAYPGGENGEAVWNRCNELIDSIRKENYNRIAIICHGGTIRSILCGILNIPQEKRFYFGYPIENCSISIIKYIDPHFYIHTVNDCSHISKSNR